MRTKLGETIKRQIQKRAIRGYWCTLLVLYFQSLAPTSLSAQLTPEKQYAAGLIAAHKMNVDSWRQADFLMQVVQHSTGTSWDSDKPRGEDGDFSIDRVEEFYYRIAFDTKHNWITTIVASSDDYLIRNRNDEIVESKISPTTFPRIAMHKDKLTTSKPKPYRFPSLALAGLYGFGVHIDPTDSIKVKSWASLLSADGITSVQDLSSNILEINNEIGYSGAGQPQRLRKIEINQNDFNPRAVRIYYVDQNSGETRLEHSHQIEWKPNESGLFVPQKIKQQHSQVRSVEKRRFAMDTETNVVIHWFSVNQETDDALPDPALEDQNAKPKQFQQNKTALRELVSPEKTNATYILENRLEARLLE